MYNQIEKLRIDDLKTEHVRIILLAIPTRRMSQWYACREGDMTWQLISEIPEFYEDVRALKGLAPAGEAAVDKDLAHEVKKADMLETRVHKKLIKPLRRASDRRPKPTKPPTIKSGHSDRRPLFEDLPTEERTGSAFHVIATPSKERRTARRYPRALDFSVRLKDQIFACETKDISIGGVSLSETLPSWVPKTFRARLTHGGLTVRVLCQRVTGSKMKIVEAESWDVIRKWIVKW